MARHDAIKTELCVSMGRVIIRMPYKVTGIKEIGAYIEERLRGSGLGPVLEDASQPES